MNSTLNVNLVHCCLFFISLPRWYIFRKPHLSFKNCLYWPLSIVPCKIKLNQNECGWGWGGRCSRDKCTPHPSIQSSAVSLETVCRARQGGSSSNNSVLVKHHPPEDSLTRRFLNFQKSIYGCTHGARCFKAVG